MNYKEKEYSFTQIAVDLLKTKKFNTDEKLLLCWIMCDCENPYSVGDYTTNIIYNLGWEFLKIQKYIKKLSKFPFFIITNLKDKDKLYHSFNILPMKIDIEKLKIFLEQ